LAGEEIDKNNKKGLCVEIFIQPLIRGCGCVLCFYNYGFHPKLRLVEALRASMVLLNSSEVLWDMSKMRLYKIPEGLNKLTVNEIHGYG
jgi:hypothetical protein